MGELKNIWLDMLTPVDTTVSTEPVKRLERMRLCSSKSAGTGRGICKCVFWWAVAMAIGMLLARLH